jgi:hypothetical protein
MSLRTLFKCDRCGGEWEQFTKECPQEINIVVKLNYGSHHPAGDEGYEAYKIAHDQTWCRPCLDKSGVITSDLLNRLGFNQRE